MTNRYLYIKEGEINYVDNVFSGFARRRTKDELVELCLEKAEEWRNSKFGNYSNFSRAKREEIARRWEAAKDLPDGKYDYYFNLEDKREAFAQAVKELAKKLGISYELKLN